ncbi:hypothetical protein YTPLAS18_38570 [Nitrospira sp.]|nr:hypothetical protein YTPLAS18_38570 [Nitrospira sp.]
MNQSNISTWLQFALQQMAAESYLDQLVSGRQLKDILTDGNNDIRMIRPEEFLGKTRFTDQLTSYFVPTPGSMASYQILDHHANDATGFSATLIKDLSDPAGTMYTLSFRSVEFQNQGDGGDWERDGASGAAGEIAGTGFALAQLVSMERYYRELKANPDKLPPNAVLNVTGYSLGGHLATVFTELHLQDVNQTVTFNGAGRGHLLGGSPGLPEEEQIRELLQYVEVEILKWDPSGEVFTSGTAGNIYDQSWYKGIRGQAVVEYTPTNSFVPPGEVGTSPGFEKITQLVGSAFHGDQPFVANSGVHGSPTELFIEDQPDFDGVGGIWGGPGSFGTSHSITLLVDSLALMELFQEVDDTLDQATIERIFAAASSQRASGFIGTSGIAEGNSLENALDALHKIIDPAASPTSFGRQTGDFGSLFFRNQFYAHMEEIRGRIAPGLFQIQSLVGNEHLAGSLARSATTDGMAYRYALKELNPFVVLGVDYGVLHNQDQSLDLYDAKTGQGTWTALALSDRADLLAKRLQFNTNDGDTVPTDTHYVDVQSGFEVGGIDSANEVIFGDDRVGDVIIGHSGGDHLYGRGGADSIEGNGGSDYIEGGNGNDPLLSGGSGNDIIFGQEGNDFLVGGEGLDTLDGGLGDDRLEGGTGADRYVYFTGQGLDRIKDSDEIGSIIFDRYVLVGGIRKEDDQIDTYRSLDGQFTYVKKGADLVINGELTIENFDFTSGSLGIKLADTGNLPDGSLPPIDYGSPDPALTRTSVGTEGNDQLDLSGGGGRYVGQLYGLGGNDYLISISPYGTDQMFGGTGSDVLAGGMDNDQLHGDEGNDGLIGGAGQDVLYGGEGQDVLIGDWISGTLSTPDADYLDGGAGNDTLQGQDAGDTLLGGDGDDELYGDDSPVSIAGQPFENPTPRRQGDDYLDGGAGHDFMAAGLGDDVLYGRSGNDFLYGDNSPAGDLQVWQGNPDIPLFDGFTMGIATGDRQAFFSREGGSDYLDGGDGDDYLQGDGGDDVLLGGTGADQLLGDDDQIAAVQEGQDWLEGGAGNDLLVGGGGEDALFGGDDDDVLVGDYANNSTLGFDDTLDGGAGNDELQGGGGADLLKGGTGNDRLFGQDGEDTLYGGAGDDIGLGGAGDDVLSGEDGNDQLDGEAGDDLLFGDEGNDILFGGAGQDLLDGGTGDDFLIAGDGDDTLFGGNGADELQGGAGADLLSGGLGNDRLFGQDGNDQLFGDEGNDLLRGEGDNDVLFGGAGLDRLFGDDGDDQLYGEEGADTLEGGAGADLLEGGTGDDHLDGGSGDDTYHFNLGDGSDVIVDAAGEGNLVRFGPGITSSDLVLTPVAGALQIRVGSAGDRLTIQGFAAGNLSAPFAIDRYEFADGTVLTHAALISRGFTYVGTTGNDVLVGGTSGLNILAGGAGDDTYVVTHETDRIIEYPGGGTDTVRTSVDFTLPDQVENLSASISEGESGGPVRLTGNQLGNVIQALSGVATDNVLEGLGGNDQLFGFEGNDVLDGGTGDDVLNGGVGSDTYWFGVGDGQDVAIDQSAPGSDIDTVQFKAGVSPTDVRLRLEDNQQTGMLDLAVELISSGDRLILRNRFAERMTFADGTVWDAAMIESRTEGLTLTASPTGSALFGTTYRDTLIGSEGNDYLDGRGDTDTMIGGNGNDTYVVDQPGESVIEAAGQGRDTVQSFVDFTLPENVENLELNAIDFFGPTPLNGSGNNSDNDLRGNYRNNILQGGGGNDRLWGGFSDAGTGPGDDKLFGGAGDDTYFYTSVNEGVDTIHDTVIPGEGNRLAFGGQIRPQDLTLTEVAGNLRIDVGSVGGAVVLAGYDSSDVNGNGVVERVEFGRQIGSENVGFEIELSKLQDVTYGTAGGDVLIGTAGVDVLRGNAGDDELIGSEGNDILSGGEGSDTYVFNLGDGVDLIDDLASTSEQNRVVFGAGITPDSLRLETSGVSSDALLTIHVGPHGDAIQFLGFQPYDSASPRAVDIFEFADGTTKTFDALVARGAEMRGTNADDGELFGTFANDLLRGFGGSDSLYGDQGDDVLIGGLGNDYLTGGNGSDTYVYNLGDGVDEIEDDVDRFHVPVDHNRVVFGPGITPADINWSDRNGGLFIAVGSDGGGVNLGPYVDAVPFGISTLEFADGTALHTETLIDAVVNSGGIISTGETDDNLLVGGQGADELMGGSGRNLILGGDGNDSLIGGSGPNHMYGGNGDDVLQGGTGSNVMHGGSGSNLLLAGSGPNTFLIDPSGALNTIRFPTPPVPGDNRIEFGGSYGQFNPSLGLGSLMIRYGTEGGELHIEGFDPSNAYQNSGIDTFAFSDRILSYSELIDLGFDLSGTVAGEVLVGTSATDRMSGLEGNDELRGGEGNDELTGGAGDDLLVGGAGNDTYHFNVGDGVDTIQDDVEGDGSNDIRFGLGISRRDLTVTQDSEAHTLSIRVGWNGDTIQLTNFDPTGVNGTPVIKTLAFADGSTVELAELIGGPVNHEPTVFRLLDNLTIPEDTSISISIPSDTFADADGGELTLSTGLANGEGLPTWLSFDAATHTFSGTPNDAQVGTWDLRVTATDPGCLSVTDSFLLTVTNVNEAPTVDALLADQMATEDAPFTFSVPMSTFADEDLVHGDTLAYSAALADGTAVPSWLTFDPVTRTFSGTPDNADVGTLALTLSATDTAGLTTATGLNFTVRNVNDAPTLTHPIVDQSAEEDSPFMLVIPSDSFADEDLIHGDVLTYGASLADGNPLPNWLDFDQVTHSLTGTPGPGDAGTFQLAVTASDTQGVSVSTAFLLNVSGPLPQTLAGTEGDDVLIGGRGDDALLGFGGDDLLSGGDSADWLDGGPGADSMVGGAGDDTYLVDSVEDVVAEGVNGGTDTVRATISYTLGNHVENLTLTGGAALNGTGNGLDNTLIGNSGINVLRGRAGNDTYVVGAGDTVIETADQGTDTVQSEVSWILSSYVENLTLTGSDSINGFGNGLNNVLVGNSVANTLDGGSGHDTIRGMDGNDSLIGGSGNDVLMGDAGDDVLSGGSGVDDLDGGDGDDQLDGGSGDDRLAGGAGDDILVGGSGSDDLIGGGGNDLLNGGSGTDRYFFSRGDGRDLITDSSGTDVLNFESGINPLDLMISRQANDLRLSLYGTADQVTIGNWYGGAGNQIETLTTGSGQQLINSQVDQLIQAMASFTQQTGLSWEDAIAQRPQDVQAVLAASWQ